MGFSKEDRDKKLTELMNKAARGDFALKDPQTGEKLSPEDTQAEIMRRINAARELPEEHKEKLEQAKLDDLNDVPTAIRRLNLRAEFEGSPMRFEWTPERISAAQDDEMQTMMQQAEEMEQGEEADTSSVSQPQQQRKFKP